MAIRQVSSYKHVSFPQRIRDLGDQVEKRAARCGSLERIEFKFCALLAGWESTALHDSKASYWFDLWQERCRKRHRGKAGRTLADPVTAASESGHRHVPGDERIKAYKRVRDGLRQVFKRVLDHYYPEGRDHLSLAAGTSDSAVLFQKVGDSFKSAAALAGPEGLEVFVLTLIELFEESLGTHQDSLISHKAWLSEIRRRRLGGSPETRTLADVAPADVRLDRQNAMPEQKRIEITRKMLSSMRQITGALESYLEKRTSTGGRRPKSTRGRETPGRRISF
jgi:hypothetical protein